MQGLRYSGAPPVPQRLSLFSCSFTWGSVLALPGGLAGLGWEPMLNSIYVGSRLIPAAPVHAGWHLRVSPWLEPSPGAGVRETVQWDSSRSPAGPARPLLPSHQGPQANLCLLPRPQGRTFKKILPSQGQTQGRIQPLRLDLTRKSVAWSKVSTSRELCLGPPVRVGEARGAGKCVVQAPVLQSCLGCRPPTSWVSPADSHLNRQSHGVHDHL